MTILFENDIQRAIISCKPLKIAVAYIGTDWSKFIPEYQHLDTIIVSPTLGSNPLAIAEIVKKIGWDKVYFLDELHAKMYIGAETAIIGSANLTKNGLSGDKLFEICTEIKSYKKINELNNIFQVILDKAVKKYPTIDSKKNRLKELEKIWRIATSHQMISSKNNRIPSFSNFELLGDDHFYILWYQSGDDYEYSEDVKSMQSLMHDEIHFSASDDVEKNKWALVWEITAESKPESKEIEWMYIHEIFENGIISDGYEYSTCAIQRKDIHTPPVPFNITKSIDIAFKKAIQDKEISKYLIQNGKKFKLSYSKKGVKLLIDKMKTILKDT